MLFHDLSDSGVGHGPAEAGIRASDAERAAVPDGSWRRERRACCRLLQAGGVRDMANAKATVERWLDALAARDPDRIVGLLNGRRSSSPEARSPCWGA
jgi:hypothetical protein